MSIYAIDSIITIILLPCWNIPGLSSRWCRKLSTIKVGGNHGYDDLFITFCLNVEKFHVESPPRSDRLGNQGECGQPGRDNPGPGWPSSIKGS